MALRKVLHFPDPRLRLKAEPVRAFDAELKALIADMFETMYAYNGAGLAATQINVQKSVIVMDLSRENTGPQYFINMKILKRDGEQNEEEGCLSVPNVYAKVKRAATVSVSYQDQEGKEHTLDADGLLAICIQHELEHLEGIVYIDHLSPTKRQRLLDQMTKRQRENI